MEDLCVEVGPETFNHHYALVVPNVGTTAGWMDDLRRIIERHPGVTWDLVMSPNQSRPVSYCRFECMARLRRRGWSTTKIGKHLGGRDHTTAIHGLRRFDALVNAGIIQPVLF